MRSSAIEPFVIAVVAALAASCGGNSGGTSHSDAGTSPGSDAGTSPGSDAGPAESALAAQFVGRWKGVGTTCAGGDSVVEGPPILAVCPNQQILLTGSSSAGGISATFTFCGPFTAQAPVYSTSSSECQGQAAVAGCFPKLNACTWDVWDHTDAELYFALTSSKQLVWLEATCEGGSTATISFEPDTTGGTVTDETCASSCPAPSSASECTKGSSSSGSGTSTSQCGDDCDCPGPCGVCQSGKCSTAIMGPYGCTAGC
jgi:hypothetical protein